MSLTTLFLLFATTGSPQDTVRVSLTDAIDRALASNALLVSARAEARGAHRSVTEATRGLLPTVELQANVLRTNDPVAVFGLKLRQERFTGPDLTLDALNRPAPATGFTIAASVTQPVLSPEAVFGYRAARRGVDAGQAMVRRHAGATRLQTVQAYWDAVLSRERLRALDAALTAARAHARQAEALAAQGLTTGLDARLTRIRVAEVEARRIAAAAATANARGALGLILAVPEGTTIQLRDTLHPDPTSSCGAGLGCDTERGDVTAARLGLEAADHAVRRAWAANLPSLVAFGSLARHAPGSPWGSGSADWTVGAALVWKPFQGLAGLGGVRAARGERAGLAARLDHATQQATLDQRRAIRHVAAARARIGVAAAARDEARVALEQARLRYRTGIAPVSELLDVQAAQTTAELTWLEAQRDLLVSVAVRDFAYGAFDQ